MTGIRSEARGVIEALLDLPEPERHLELRTGRIACGAIGFTTTRSYLVTCARCRAYAEKRKKACTKRQSKRL